MANVTLACVSRGAGYIQDIVVTMMRFVVVLKVKLRGTFNFAHILVRRKRCKSCQSLPSPSFAR